MLLLLFMLRIRVPYMFSELGFRVAVADDAKRYTTFPDDYMDGDEPKDGWHGLYKQVKEMIEEHPGTWPT